MGQPGRPFPQVMGPASFMAAPALFSLTNPSVKSESVVCGIHGQPRQKHCQLSKVLKWESHFARGTLTWLPLLMVGDCGSGWTPCRSSTIRLRMLYQDTLKELKGAAVQCQKSLFPSRPPAILPLDTCLASPISLLHLPFCLSPPPPIPMTHPSRFRM